MLACGVLLTSAAVYSAKQESNRAQAERNELFATLGGMLQRSALNVRVAEQVGAPAEELPLCRERMRLERDPDGVRELQVRRLHLVRWT